MRIRLALLVAILTALVVAPAWAVTTPAGFDQQQSNLAGDGSVIHQTLTGNGQVINIAVVQPGAGAAFQVVTSNDQLAEPNIDARLERTSSATQRSGSLACANGDFYYTYNFHPEWTGIPVGGVVSDGRMLRSPDSNPGNHQFVVRQSGRMEVSQLPWLGSVISQDLHSWLHIDAVNRDRGPNQLVLYTSDWGPSTLTNQYDFELVMKLDDPHWSGDLGHEVGLAAEGPGDPGGNTAITPGHVVLSANGSAATALHQFWDSQQATPARLRLDTLPETDQAVQSLGAQPTLLRDGQWAAENDDPSVNPNTTIAWNNGPDGLPTDWALIVMDGRQPGARGADYQGQADMARELGFTQAVNLDSGGSSTLADGHGAVLNTPSGALVRRNGVEKHVEFTAAGDDVISHEERPVADFACITATLPSVTLAAATSGQIPQPETGAVGVPATALPALLPRPISHGSSGPAAGLAALMIALVGWLLWRTSPATRRN